MVQGRFELLDEWDGEGANNILGFGSLHQVSGPPQESECKCECDPQEPGNPDPFEEFLVQVTAIQQTLRCTPEQAIDVWRAYHVHVAAPTPDNY